MKREKEKNSPAIFIGILTVVLFVVIFVVTVMIIKEDEEKKENTISRTSKTTLTMYSEVKIPDKILEHLEEELGIVLKITYPEDSPKEYVEKMIATGEIPDLVYTKTEGSQLVEWGIMDELNQWVEKYADNVSEYYNGNLQQFMHNEETESIYFIPFAEGATWKMDNPTGSVLLQCNFIENIQMDELSSVEQLEEELMRYMENNELDTGEEYIGITLYCQESHWLESLSLVAGMVADGYADKSQWMQNPENSEEIVYKHTTKQVKEFFKWLNKMYEKGLVDPDFATQTLEDYQNKIESGRVLCLMDYSWMYQESADNIISKGDYANSYFPAWIGMKANQQFGIYQNNDTSAQGFGITTECNEKIRAIEVLQYLYSRQGLSYIEQINNLTTQEQRASAYWGSIGLIQSKADVAEETQEATQEGTREGTQEETQEATQEETQEGTQEETQEATQEETQEATQEETQEATQEATQEETQGIIQNETEEIISLDEIQQSNYKIDDMTKVLDEVSRVGLIRCIICGEENFEKRWQELQESLKENGLEKAENYMTKEYQKKKDNQNS